MLKTSDDNLNGIHRNYLRYTISTYCFDKLHDILQID